MNILGKDLCFYLLQFVDTKDISSLARVNKFFNWLIQRKYSHVTSWRNVKKEIGKGDYYTLILAQKYKEFSLNDCLYAACRGGSLELVKEMLKRGADDELYGFYKACKNGDSDVVNFIFTREEKRSIDYMNYGMEGACIGGHEYIIDSIVEQYGGVVNYEYLIEGAFIGNNTQFLKYISEDISDEEWNRALYGAAGNNILSLINLAIEKGATDMQRALHGACHYGHLDLIINLVNDFSYEWDWDRALYHACSGGHIDIINYIIDNYACNINDGLAGACYRGKHKIIKYMVSKGANNWNSALRNACEGRKLHVVKMICEEKIEHITKVNVERCINEYAQNEETKKYLKSVLQKMK